MLTRLPLTLILLVISSVHSVAQDTLPPNNNNSATPALPQAEQTRLVNYLLAYDVGRMLRDSGTTLDRESILTGLEAGLKGDGPPWKEDEIAATMGRFNQVLNKNWADMAAKENKERGAAFLAENGSKDGVVQTDSGLQYKVLASGEGASPTLRNTVRCHYRGTTIDGEEFDSSYSRGEPAEFPVAGVIAGWTEALQMMKVGDKYQLFIPSDLAYGERGAGGAIGPNETLIFEVELLGIVR